MSKPQYCVQCQLPEDESHNDALCDAIFKIQAKHIADFKRLRPDLVPKDRAELEKWADAMMQWLFKNRKKRPDNLILDVPDFLEAATRLKADAEGEVLRTIAKVNPGATMSVEVHEVPADVVPPLDLTAILKAAEAKAVKTAAVE